MDQKKLPHVPDSLSLRSGHMFVIFSQILQTNKYVIKVYQIVAMFCHSLEIFDGKCLSTGCRKHLPNVSILEQCISVQLW